MPQQPVYDPYANTAGPTSLKSNPVGPDPVDPDPAPHESTTGRLLMAFLVLLIGINISLSVVLSRRGARHRIWLTERLVPLLRQMETTLSVAAPPQPAPPEDLSPAETRTIGIFRAASPAVVFITTISLKTDIFRRNVMAIPRGTGSGFMWDMKGHIVTNYHVIRDGNAAKVTLSDQSSYEARLVGSAPDKDLAVLAIDAPIAKLKPLGRGVSKELVVGQQTLAIGNPFGLDHTLSVGVISGLNREIKSVGGRPIQGVIQTDAAINPGNSGGPLLDSSGRLIGINTAIFSPSGASAGIGFAVPVDTVERIVPQLIQHGRVIRPGLGIQIAEKELATRAGVVGVLILSVLDGSPAERAGIRPTLRDPRSNQIVLGDVITAIDEKAVKEPNDLYRQLDEKKVGDRVRLRIRRGQRETTIVVPLREIAN
jgi:S1-C subfamily serine protease